MNRKTALLVKIVPPMAAAVLLLFGGCGKKNPPVALFPLVTKEDIQIGGDLYKSRCAICHGMPDKGNPPRFAPLVTSPIVKGDPLPLAEAILYGKGHIAKEGDPYFFEGSDDTTIARIGNYLKAQTGATEAPMRSKTVSRARDIHHAALEGLEPAPEAEGSNVPPPEPDRGE